MKKFIFTLLLTHCFILTYAQTTLNRNKGYKGDISLGINADLSCDCMGAALTTSHGYQLNSYLYLGGGIGYENEMIPLFGHVKTYFSKNVKRINPWAEVKLGLDVGNIGFYWSPAVGFTVPVGENFGISCSMAYGANTYWDEHNIGMRLGFHF